MDWTYDDFGESEYSSHRKEHLMWENRPTAPRGWHQNQFRRPLHPAFSRRSMALVTAPATATAPTSTQSPRSLDEATVFLIEYLDKNKDEIIKVIQHLRVQGERGACLGYMPSWFQLLGKTVFAGQITPQNVRLREREFRRQDRPGVTYVPDVQPNSNTIEIYIHTRLLNAYRGHIHVGTQALAILLHQMIHAYFLIMCGPQTDGKDPDGRLKHGEHFSCILYKIKEHSGACGIPLPLDSGHNIPCQPYNTNNQARWSLMRRQKMTDYTCSDCTATSEGIKEDKAKAWYRDKCVKAVDPDVFEYKAGGKPVATPLSKCGNRKEWIELTYRKKPYKVDRMCVDKYNSFKKILEGDQCKLNIPEDVEEEVFECLMRFLASGTYGQSLASTNNGITGRPPIIEDVKEQWPPFILTEIKLHQLCSALGFMELRRTAMKRLNDQRMCHEEPANILKAIYKPDKEPDKDLRTWARSFMKRWIPTPGQYPIETSNWKKLFDDSDLQEQMDYRQGLCSVLLRIDFDEVGEELRKLQYAPTPSAAPQSSCTHVQPQSLASSYYSVPPQLQLRTDQLYTFPSDIKMHPTFQEKFHAPHRSWPQHEIEIELQQRPQYTQCDLTNCAYGSSASHLHYQRDL